MEFFRNEIPFPTRIQSRSCRGPPSLILAACLDFRITEVGEALRGNIEKKTIMSFFSSKRNKILCERYESDYFSRRDSCPVRYELFGLVGSRLTIIFPDPQGLS
jgi:hypothetical protein